MTLIADLNTLLASPKTSHIVIYCDDTNAATAMANPIPDFAFNYTTNVLSVRTNGTWSTVGNTITTTFKALTVNQAPPSTYYGIQRGGLMDGSWPPNIGSGYIYIVPDWATLLAIGSSIGELAIINDKPYMLAMTPSMSSANWVSMYVSNPTLVNPTLISPYLDTPTGGDLSNCFVPKIKEYVKNDTGAVLTKGSAVYVSGANGTNVLVSLAKADTEPASSKTLGIIEADIAVNGMGYVITQGVLTGINTNAATNEGDPVWLSPTVAGGFVYGVANKPLAPYHLVYIGVVTRKNANNGEIFIKVQNGYEVEELHDVAISNISDMDTLRYEASTSLWKNKPLTLTGKATVSATAATNTIPVYVSAQSVLYYTTNSTGNFTLNLTHSASATLVSTMNIGQIAEASFAATNGATAFYSTAIQVDGSTTGVTTKWQGAVPSAGNINSIDLYTFKIIKTAATTFTVLASMSKFV